MRTTRRLLSKRTSSIKTGCSSLLDSSFHLLTFSLSFQTSCPLLRGNHIPWDASYLRLVDSWNPPNSDFFSLDLLFSCMLLLSLVLLLQHSVILRLTFRFLLFFLLSVQSPTIFPIGFFLTDSAWRLGTLDYTFLSWRPPDLFTDVLSPSQLASLRIFLSFLAGTFGVADDIIPNLLYSD